MSRMIDDLSQEEREALAEDLSRLADQLDEPDLGEPDSNAIEALENQGLTSDQAHKLADETDPDEIAETLRESGIDPRDALGTAGDRARGAQPLPKNRAATPAYATRGLH